MSQRISVAMATYNGVRYIEEQLLSICRQTRRPDEIVISDDGSKDATLKIVEKVARSEVARGVEFIVLTNNPRHGYCGNFEWAVRHATGDLIFLSDQDDVWDPEKVKKIENVFAQNPDACCVCHNASLIEKNGKPIPGIFDQRFCTGELNIPEGHIIKLDRQKYLESAVSDGGIHGMSMCLSKQFVKISVPFPVCSGEHDKWLTACAVMNDGMYYLNLPLTLYRLHGSNTCGNSAYKGGILDVLKRKWNKLSKGKSSYEAYYVMASAIKSRLEMLGYADHAAHKVAIRQIQIGEMLRDAESSGRLVGAIKLIWLFCTDMRYRRSGTNAFLLELAYILRVNKKKRLQIIGGN